LEVIRGIRDRYDGEYRNPWNEFECGSNYARSMASYALMLVYSGFRFDMRKNRMGMLPLHPGSYFWSVDGAWGTSSYNSTTVRLEVQYGELQLREWVVPHAENITRIFLNGNPIRCTFTDDILDLGNIISLTEGSVLEARY